MVATDEWNSSGRPLGRETAFNAGFATDAPNCLRLRKSLEHMLASVLNLKDAANQTIRTVAHADRIYGRERLNPRGEIRRLPDNRLFPSDSRADDIADNDQTARDADPNVKLAAPGSGQLRYGLNNGEGGAHSAFGAILMRVGKAKIGEYTVAHELS